MKCYKCAHYYRVMVTEEGYNPSPCCHLYEDEGKHPNVLTKECFKKRGRSDGKIRNRSS